MPNEPLPKLSARLVHAFSIYLSCDAGRVSGRLAAVSALATPGKVTLRIALPEGYHLTEGANSNVVATLSQPDGSGATVSPETRPLRESSGGLTAAFELSGRAEEGAELRAVAKVYYCRDGDVCLFKELGFRVPLGGGGAVQELLVEAAVRP